MNKFASQFKGLDEHTHDRKMLLHHDRKESQQSLHCTLLCFWQKEKLQSLQSKVTKSRKLLCECGQAMDGVYFHLFIIIFFNSVYEWCMCIKSTILRVYLLKV